MRQAPASKLKLFTQFIKNKFSKKKKTNSKIILNKIENGTFTKKRNNFNVRVDYLEYFRFFQKNYIPYYLIGGLSIIIITIFLVLGPIFTVKYIEIIKKDNITNMNIAYKAVEDLRGEKLYKINELDVFNKFKNYQDNIKSISLKIQLPNTIKIEAESYKEIFNVLINNNTYILVENGTVIPSPISKSLKNLNVIMKIDKNKFIDYKQIFNPFYIEKINNIITKLEENIVNIKIVNLYYYENERELHIEIENGNRLIFSIDDDIDPMEQIEKLVIFNKDYSSIIDNKIVYIDLRIKKKIFYCEAVSSKQCNENIKSIYGE
ncbi:MAG: hypothetical protein PHV23_02015 [Candidatus Gracilibacteria bacterium]|nr:hypothetical protein [Candidatus Gracilibacteria bacterium]